MVFKWFVPPQVQTEMVTMVPAPWQAEETPSSRDTARHGHVCKSLRYWASLASCMPQQTRLPWCCDLRGCIQSQCQQRLQQQPRKGSMHQQALWD